MKNEPAKFVKNIKTGVVFQLTRILAKMRKDLIPCTRAGIPLAHANVDMPNLYNPFTNLIVPNSGDNSLIAGLIPCRDRKHADEIRESLMGSAVGADDDDDVDVEETTGLKEPESPVAPPLSTAPGKADEVIMEGFKVIDVDAMDKAELKAFAMKHFDVKLNGQKGEDTLREELQSLINSKIAA